MRPRRSNGVYITLSNLNDYRISKNAASSRKANLYWQFQRTLFRNYFEIMGILLVAEMNIIGRTLQMIRTNAC